MKKYVLTGLMAFAIAGTAFLVSCSDDEDGKPSISLSETDVTASAGEEVAVTVTTKTPAGFKNLVVTKMWDGVAVPGEEETFTEPLDDDYVYTVVEEDADHVVTINFTVTDKNNKTASKDLVITIELTARQLLLKYNWRLNEEIRKKTGLNDIQDVYTDDVYRFNADGTYEKSIGAKNDENGDKLTNYCFYDLNETTVRLLMSKSVFTANFTIENRTDTLDIVLIDETKFHAKINYYGLDQLGIPGYDPIEEYEKRFVAVAKTSTFDPYEPGASDDETGPLNECVEVTFENGRKKK